MRLFRVYAKRTYKFVSLMLRLVATFHSVRQAYIQIHIFNVVAGCNFSLRRQAYVQNCIHRVVAGCEFSRRTPSVCAHLCFFNVVARCWSDRVTESRTVTHIEEDLTKYLKPIGRIPSRLLSVVLDNKSRTI